MATDLIGNPTQHCKRHGEDYYFYCRKCYDLDHDKPVHLRVASPQGETKGKRRK
jgi:hypothetical protein